MAQLRDKRTSELLASGTPAEMVALADRIGRDEVLFDGVGEGFDPDAVKREREETVAGLEGAAGEAKGEEKTRLADAAKAARAEFEPDAKHLDRAQAKLEQARDRLP